MQQLKQNAHEAHRANPFRRAWNRLTDWGESPVIKQIVRMHLKNDLNKALRMGKTAVPALVGCLKDKDGDVRDRAAKVLGHIALAHPEYDLGGAIPALAECLGDVWAQYYAVVALTRMGQRSIPALLDVLGKGNEMERQKAALALYNMAKDEKVWLSAIPGLVAALRDKSNDVKESAAFALIEIAGKNPEAVANPIVEFVNGKEGDGLVEINESNEQTIVWMNRVLLECGKAMKNAA